MSEETPPKWTMPPVKQFHRVYVGKHPAQLESNKKRLGGFVTRVGSETIEAVTFAPGQYLGQAWECRHIEDPILLSNPELMRDDHIAVFKLAEMELIGRDDGQARANYDAWEQADNDLRVLRRRVDLLENKVALLQQPRKRGRPPKNQESQIPVSSDV